MENQSIYEDKALFEAFEKFVLENQTSVPAMMDIIGKDAIYLVFVSGYMSALDFVSGSIKNEFSKIQSVL